MSKLSKNKQGKEDEDTVRDGGRRDEHDDGVL